MKCKKILEIIRNILLFLVDFMSIVGVWLAGVVYFGIQWMFDTWTNLSMNELVFHLTSPIEGTNMDIIYDFLDKCMAPAVLLMMMMMILMVAINTKWKHAMALLGVVVASGVIAFTLHSAWVKLDASEYVASKGEKSTFVEDYYVDPSSVELIFPEQKRNLIMIFLVLI